MTLHRKIIGFARSLKTALSRTAPSLSLLFGNRQYSGNNSLSYKDAVTKGYKGLVWVYRCINAYGDAIGSVPWKAYRLVDGQEVPAPGHPLEKLINNPNKFTTRQEFMSAFCNYLFLHGNVYLEIVFVQGKPYQLFQIRPDFVAPRPDPIHYIKDYEVKIGNKPPIYFEPKECIHFKLIDPLNEYVGMSPLTAASRTVELEDSAIQWNLNLFANNAVPGGVLEVPAQVLDNQEKQEILASLEDNYTGDGSHRPLVLWGGMKWTQMSLSQTDTDFVVQRRLSKYEICGVFGVPPSMIGANEDLKYANHASSRLSFWEDRVSCLLEWIQTKLNNALGPIYNDGVYLKYDISGVPAMRDNFANLAQTAKLLVDRGYDLNSVNQRLNLGMPNVPWGSVSWKPSSLIPVSGQEAIADPAILNPQVDENPYTGLDEEQPD